MQAIHERYILLPKLFREKWLPYLTLYAHYGHNFFQDSIYPLLKTIQTYDELCLKKEHHHYRQAYVRGYNVSQTPFDP